MKIEADAASATSVTAYGVGWIRLGREKITHSLLIQPDGTHQVWPCASFADLSAAHFAPLAAMDAELVIFGSGNTLRFVPTSWIQGLINQQIGFETMDAQTACRTYNVLLAEDRRVALALLLEPA